MEMAIHDKLRAAQMWRQIILAPKALRGAGEHSLGVGAVAAEVVRQAHDAVEIGAGRLAFVFIMIMTMTVTIAVAIALQLAQGFPRQVFGQDRVLLVGFVARGGGLKVETESAGSLIFKLG